MIKKLIRQMLTAQIFSALTVSMCLLIDSIVIGRFLGVKAIAAYGLSNPVLLVIGAFGTALSAGVQVVCSKSLGKGSQEETNKGFSSAVGMAMAFAIPFTILVFAFSAPISRLLGADAEVFADTNSYIRGFIIGAPATTGALILVPFLQMAGKMNLLIASVGVMTVTDIALDLLNVTVFHGGMFGMGLASSLSYYAGMLIGGSYFISSKCFFRFSFDRIRKEKICEIVRNSIPAIFHMASNVILVFGMNRLLLGTGGNDAVAAFSVVLTIGNASCCITTGIGGVSLTMTGIFYNEEDQTGLRILLKELAHASVLLGCLVGLLINLFARPAVSLFIKEAGVTKHMAVQGLRFFTLGLVPGCLNSALKNAFQSAGKEKYTEIISVVQCAVFPLLSALILSIPFHTAGAMLYFFCGEMLTLAAVCIYVKKKTGRKAWQDLNVLMLPDDFSVLTDELWETDILDLDEAEKSSEQAFRYCMKRTDDKKISNRIAVCVEEMATNVIQHGFTKDDKEHHLSIRLMHKNSQWILRFRDDCTAFDPISYVPPEGSDKGLGIRLVLKIADDIRYTYSMSLNNLMLILKDSTIDSLKT